MRLNEDDVKYDEYIYHARLMFCLSKEDIIIEFVINACSKRVSEKTLPEKMLIINYPLIREQKHTVVEGVCHL